MIFAPRPPAEPTDPGVEEEEQAGCVAARNVEFLIDDSGSMELTDPQLLRRTATELLISKPRNAGEVLGAYEFGSVGTQVFAPQVIEPRGPGSNQPALFELLAKSVGADNGGTNYNAAFEGVASDNPGAQARIFLTDGEHNEGEYIDGHRGGPPTYVIGLGIGRRGDAARRLARIAEDTGGRYYAGVTAQNLQPVLNRIDSRLNCDVQLDSDVDTLTEARARRLDRGAARRGRLLLRRRRDVGRGRGHGRAREPDAARRRGGGAREARLQDPAPRARPSRPDAARRRLARPRAAPADVLRPAPQRRPRFAARGRVPVDQVAGDRGARDRAGHAIAPQELARPGEHEPLQQDEREQQQHR